jgi:hypothetical protein
MKIRILLQLNLILLGLFLNSASLGMLQVGGLKRQLPNKKINHNAGIRINKDALIEIAAQDAQGTIKNTARKTCKKLHAIISKTNPLFVSLPTFMAHPRDMNHIILFFSWNNNDRIVKSLNRKIISSQKITFPFGETGPGMWSVGGFTCSWPIKFDADLPKKLHIQYGNPEEKIDWVANNLPSQAEIALVFAALCGDKPTLKIIVPKLKKIHESVSIYNRRMLHEDLLSRLIKHDDVKAFELIVTYDPYNALNVYDPNDKTGECDRPFLNCISERMRYDQEIKEKYVKIYKGCGGKTLEELEPTKCIIS